MRYYGLNGLTFLVGLWTKTDLFCNIFLNSMHLRMSCHSDRLSEKIKYPVTYFLSENEQKAMKERRGLLG